MSAKRKKSPEPHTTRCWEKILRPRPARAPEIRRQTKKWENLLAWLPTEVLHMIFDRLTVREISVFAMISKENTQIVLGYISFGSWKNRTIFRNLHNPICRENTAEHCRSLGLLFKRCTFLQPTKERLKFIFTHFSQMPCFMLSQCIAPGCFGFTRYGIFLQTVTAGWDETECLRVFNYLCEFTDLFSKTKAVLATTPGLKPFQEIQIRHFCRQVLLDPWEEATNRLWLTELLKPWPLVSKAHLLFILYGPVQAGGTLGWEDLVTRNLPNTALSDLARAIVMVFGKIDLQSQEIGNMIGVLEELVVLPQPWHMENLARILLMCGNRLSFAILASKAFKGRVNEVSRLIFHIILVCEKERFDMTWAVNLVMEVLTIFRTPTEKLIFIQQVQNTFSDMTRELFENSLAGNHFGNPEILRNFCTILDAIANFHARFLFYLLE